MMITVEDLRDRHAVLLDERAQVQREARERDMGYAYVLGEIERLIALAEERANDQKGDE